MEEKDEDTNLSPADKLAKARFLLMKRYPYFSAALLGLIPKEAPNFGTMGVTNRLTLYWDPEFIKDKPLDFVIFLLIHEIGHILYKHHDRFKAFGLPKDDEKKLHRIMNMAGDLEINKSYRDIYPYAFDKEKNKYAAGLLPEHYGLPDDKTMEFYFDELRKLAKDHKCSCGHGKLGEEGIETEEQPGVGRSDKEIERIRKETAENIKEAAKQAGNVPGYLELWADELLKPPKIRWQDILARSVRGAIAYKKGHNELSQRYLNRKQWGIGFKAGTPKIPSYYSPVPHIAIAMDTSGSMCSKEILGRAQSEVNGILKSTGAKVTFISADCAVQKVQEISSVKELDSKKLLAGGGGTDFNCVFQCIEKMKDRVSVLIFITDGQGSAPEISPKGLHTIWVILDGVEPTKWGKYIHIKTDEI